jgi:parvulin-like peptidyl-prolyl isomerase
MLEKLRRQSGSFIIWILFAIIILAFVLFFGPQASGELGCGASKDFVLQVDDTPVDQHDWRFAMLGLQLGSSNANTPEALRKRYQAFDALVERALLANAARKAGLNPSEELIHENIKRGEIYILGNRVDGRQAYFIDGYFSIKALENWSNALGLPNVDLFIEQQKEEVLANYARALLSGTHISTEEARHRYIEQNTQVTLAYVLFDKKKYQDALSLSEAEVIAYLDKHADEVKARFDADEANYKAVPPQARARMIMLEKYKEEPPPAGESEEDAAKRTAATEKAREKYNAAQKRKADSLLAKLKSGADFSTLAAKESEHAASKDKGGDLGWQEVSAFGYGAAVTDAITALEAGKTSEVLESNNGFHIFAVDRKREGDLSFDDVKDELAESLALEYYGEKNAERAAEEALAKAASTPLKELFGTEEEPEDATKTGSVLYRSDVIPASWPPVHVVAQEGAAAAEPKADEPKADEPKADEPKADEPKADDSSEEKKDETPEVIPVPKNVPKAELKTLGPISRAGDYLAGIGTSAELAKDAFTKLEVGKVADKVYKTSAGYVVVELTARDEANLEEFDPEETIEGMARIKGMDYQISWLQSECNRVIQTKKLQLNRSYVLDGTDEKPVIEYPACQTLSRQALLQKLLGLPSF